MMRKSSQNQRAKGKNASLLLSLANKLSRVLVLFTIFFLPTQFGKHFWPQFAFIGGLRIDYLSPTLFLTDIFLILLFLLTSFVFIFQLITSPRSVSALIRRQRFVILFLTVLLGILLLGVSLSQYPMAGWYGLAKLFEILFFGFMIRVHISLPRDGFVLFVLFGIGVLGETTLAIAQIVLQHSVGGLFYFLGERTFSAETPGIANASINGTLMLRPYATFPHPNVLAAYLAISCFLCIMTAAVLRKTIPRYRNLVTATALCICLLGTIGVAVSLSRSAVVIAGLFGLYGLFSVLHGSLKKNHLVVVWSVVIILGSILLLLTPVGYRIRSVRLGEESVVQRSELSGFALSNVSQHLLMGVGLQQELYQLPAYEQTQHLPFLLQPVHSIYLLVFQETGLIGATLFLFFIARTVGRLYRSKEKAARHLLALLFGIVLFGFLDHFFITLQQGQLLLAFVFGLSWAHFVSGTRIEKKLKN